MHITANIAVTVVIDFFVKSPNIHITKTAACCSSVPNVGKLCAIPNNKTIS